MHLQDLDLLFRLLLAHFVVDFLTGTEVQKDQKTPLRNRQFYLHLGLVGLSTYLFSGQWTNAWMPSAVLLLHGLIDWGHSRFGRANTTAFLIDQGLHLLTTTGCWILVTSNSVDYILQLITDFLVDPHYQLVLLGYLLVSVPGGVLIGYLTQKWSHEISTSGEDASSDESLQNAGKWIGILERILVLTFILLGEWRPIGFLLAAKSVFRFGDLKEPTDRKRTEYILIGTLLSFTFAIIVGLMVITLSQ